MTRENREKEQVNSQSVRKKQFQKKLTNAVSTLLPGRTSTPGYISAVLSGYGLVGANIVVQILLVPLYLSSLGKDEFGFLMFVLAMVNFAAFGIGWMSGGSIRVLGEFYAKQDGDGFRKAYNWMRMAFWGYSVLAAVVIIVLGALPGSPLVTRFSEIAPETVRATALLTAIYLMVYYDFTAMRQALTAIGKQAIANYATIASLFIFSTFVVPWLLVWNGRLPGVVTGLVAGALIARLGIGYYVKKEAPKPSSTNSAYSPRDVRSFFIGKKGAGYGVYGALLLILQADVMIIGWLGGAKMAGELVLLWKVAEIAALMLWRIPGALHPYIVHLDTNDDHKELQILYRNTQLRMLGLGLLAAMIYAMAGPTIVGMWVGAENVPGDWYAYALAGGSLFFLVVARVPSLFAFAQVRLRPLLFVIGLEVALKLIGTFLLFPHTGYLAPLIAFNIAHLLGIAYLYQVIGRPSQPKQLTTA